MKCRSVACIWPDSPPPHRVTAVAALSQPPTLYTGGSDGSIVWWNLSASEAKQEIKPVAMLCGHTAHIADLGICLPAANSGDGKIENSSNVFMSSNSADYGSLISVCTDGVLCIWSRGSGHCRRRTKMAPWVGTPFALRPLPENPRYVCIACCFTDAVNLIDHPSLDSSGGSGPSMDRHPQYQKPRKCTVVIVDSYTLTIVQTVFHGHLSIGPLRFMAIVSPIDGMEEQSVLLVDSFGKLQYVPILKGPNTGGENGTSLQKDCYNLGMTDSVEVSSKGLQVVMCAASAQVLAFIYKTYCIFQLAASGTIIGQISFINNQLCSEGGSTQLHVTGGMFLESDNASKVLKSQECHDTVAKNFAVWNNRGFAVVYKITYSDSIFGFKMLSVIPAVAYPLDVRLSICFVQLSSSLLRIESFCFDVEKPFLWKPHVTIWLLLQQYGSNWDLCQESKMLGEGRFFIDWIESSTSANENEDLRHDIGAELTGWGTQLSQRNCGPCYKVDHLGTTDTKYWSSQKERLVSSSMVISESYYIPYAVVYGFHTGEIEVVCFNVYIGGFTHSRGQCRQVENVSKQYFLGHTGPVLCLASNWMGGTANGWSFSRVLVSGSMDSTVRVWDLDSGNVLAVMHHHVAPVHQLILPPCQTGRPWNACFLSVGEDSCVALVSLETLRVERMFPGHRYNPAKVVWDGKRNYLACLCQNNSGTSDTLDVLYIWDLKTGACERVLCGTASHSMFDHFCKGITTNSLPDGILNEDTSASSLLFPLGEDASLSQSQLRNLGMGTSSSKISPSIKKMSEVNSLQTHATKENSAKLFPSVQSVLQSNKHPIKCFCPFPGLAVLSFDLASLMSPFQEYEILKDGGEKQGNTHVSEQGVEMSKDASDEPHKIPEKELGPEKPSPHHVTTDGTEHASSDLLGTSTYTPADDDWVQSLEGCLLQFSLSFLHLWDVDNELDELLITEMKLKKPGNFPVAFGLQGDRGSLTLTFPSSRSKLELWKSSSEFSAIRSLTLVSIAQRTISLSHSCSAASSALAAFYTRYCLERIPDVKPPLLQLLVSFWQDESECIRMAARSLFHCAASRAIPLPLRCQKANNHENLPTFPNGTGVSEHEVSGTEKASRNRLISDKFPETQGFSQAEESEILAWLESFEVQDWISCVGGTSQDAITSHIIVAAALAIWYPSLVKTSLATLVVHPLLKLVMAMNDKYSSTAAELLAEGMECTWKACIAPEIPRLIGDIFVQIESASGAPANISAQIRAVSLYIQETLVGILLPNLAMADVPGFLNVIESQIWSTASDSPVHVVALMALVRVIRGSPRNLVQCLDKAVNFILQTMDPSNSVMRKTCLQTSMAALKEVVRIFPMVALNDRSTRLAIGDAIGEVNNASIRVYDMQSMTKMKVLDASGPPGLPTLLGGASEVVVTAGISALSFSPDGEGLVAFSEHGLMIRWWSLGSAWWEKLSRNIVPVQCTKLIFVPPWEGFSPNSTRSSIMACVMGLDRRASFKENTGVSSDLDRLKLLIHNLDLSYRLEWVGDRKVLLTRHGQELGTFRL